MKRQLVVKQCGITRWRKAFFNWRKSHPLCCSCSMCNKSEHEMRETDRRRSARIGARPGNNDTSRKEYNVLRRIYDEACV